MWKIHGRAYSIAVIAVIASWSLAGKAAYAQDTFINQNISGFNLPGVTLPQGHDEVRAADGTTCRSAVSGSGAYLDVGVIGNPEQTNQEGSVSAYTRMVIPLGKKRGRIDCGKLYDLEVRRLEIELKLMEMGLNRGIAPVSETSPVTADAGAAEDGTESSAETDPKVVMAQADEDEDAWAKEGWSSEGLNN